MKDINLNEIKALAIAVDHADTGSAEWDRATDALNEKDIPAVLVALIEKLEAVQRERDAEVQHKREAWCEYRKLEAGLARRDAASGDPVGLVIAYAVNGYVVTGRGLSIGDSIYTAAQPAVLEQDVGNILTLLSGNEWAEHCTKSLLGRQLESAITELHNEIAEELGCQPAPVVTIPARFKPKISSLLGKAAPVMECRPDGGWVNFSAIKVALDNAGVKYE